MAPIEDLKLERSIAAAPEDVFDAWIDPALFPHWFGPQDCTIPEFELDPRVGGAWRAVMLGVQTGNRYEVSGVYTELARPERLAFTWAWTLDDGSRGPETEVTVAIAPEGRGSRVTLVHAGFADQSDRDGHATGWDSTLASLASRLERARAT
jgi:uncharacterized protein YndB with AHSA1/START domain